MLGVVVAVLGAGSASAAPSWLEPVQLGAGTDAAPAVGTGPTGAALVAWIRDGKLLIRARGADGAFAPEQIVTTSAVPAAVRTDMASDGSAVVAWIEGDRVKTVARAPDGALSSPSDVTGGGSGTPSDLQLHLDGAGGALVAFLRGGVRAARRPAGGDWGATAELATGTACSLSSDLGSAGHAAVAWRAGCAAAGDAVVLARGGGGAAFGQAEQISKGETGTATATGVAGDGTTVVTWLRNSTVRGAVAGAAAGPVQVSAENQVTGAPAAAGTARDEVVVAWRAGSGTAARIVASRATAAGFGTTGAISGDGVADAPPLVEARAADGSAFAAWRRGDLVEAARRPAGGPFTPSTAVSRTGAAAEAPDLAADDDGNALAAYRRAGEVVAQAHDGAGPRILDVVARTGGFALDPYPFSFRARDAWSAVASTGFTFPDATRDGTSTEYAFPAAGRQSFTMRATDALGNARTATQAFLVAPPFDRRSPVISDLKLDRTRFRVSRTPTAVAAAKRPARGTRFRYTLSEPAQVLIYLERVGFTRQAGKRRRVFAPAGLITRSHTLGGRVSVGFSGRIIARSGALRVLDTTLKPGRYRATLIAADAVRNVSVPLQTAFTIVR